MSHKSADNPLGQQTIYPDSYAPEQLFPVARSLNRLQLNIAEHALPFHGFDLWHAWELSWLNAKGKPVVAVGEFIIPCQSPNLVESKSLKLYLNSLNQMRIESFAAARELITLDLANALGMTPVVRLSELSNRQCQVETGTPDISTFGISTFDNSTFGISTFGISTMDAEILDSLEVETDVFLPDSSLLKSADCGLVDEVLYSDLFKSNCPVTGQPDWGTVVISYSGSQIDRQALLRYIISYRNHQGFHEHCAEMMYRDIMQTCKPEALTLTIHFLRRGGLDINPIRSTSPVNMQAKFARLIRQ